jgi:hypothetical protein
MTSVALALSVDIICQLCMYFLSLFAFNLSNTLIFCYSTYCSIRTLQKFNEFVTDGFRIVNNRDIVPRIPRSSKTNRFLQYEHVGRTVMIRADVDSAGSPEGIAPMILWVQGTHSILEVTVLLFSLLPSLLL